MKLNPLHLVGLLRALGSRPGVDRRVETITEDLTLFHCHRAHRAADRKARRRRPLYLTRLGKEIHIRS